MLLLLVILYLFFLKERLVEYSAAQNYANGKGNLERKIPKGSEFTVGEKFRVRVVLSKDLENNANFDLFKLQVKDALRFWTKAIQPKKHPTQKILIERNCDNRVRSLMRPRYHYCEGGCNNVSICNGFEIPEKYLQKCRSSEKDVVSKTEVKKRGNIDFVLFVRSHNACISESTMATADTCEKDLDTDRPIAGSIVICSAMKYLDSNPGELKRIIIHELGHTFVSETTINYTGFDYWLFPYLRYDDGSPRTRRNPQTGEPELPKHVNEGLKADRNTIQYVSRKWRTVSSDQTYQRVGLTLRSVVNFARNHFRCNELDAVDLESDGHGGSRLSHFERRLSIGEVMSPKVDIMASVSGLTLSFFKDTGWYDVNIQKTASPWCNEPITKKSGIRCIPHINAYGVCNLVNVGHTLKPEHTHFNNLPNVEPSRQNRFGGFDIHADYCPYMSMFNNVLSTTMNSHCGDINNRKYQDVHSDSQYYGKKSRCFNYGTTYMSGNRSWSFSGCFQVKCTLRFEHLVYFRREWRECPRQGGIIKTALENTRYDWIECPDFRDACSVS
ncbi:invadolysin (M08 family) [Schistosoma mansoni]|uniref:invadolysin (M08 family) n=1 Tax=Schistosoma mansoni TaxID=6183 RepID=UPI00022C81DE|nr:invadolysin (M08 family) [Schistosoma mansoni]|eukprot:XP_018644396.1 invadolysin (M08 family) [Schistosoma mansoni]